MAILIFIVLIILSAILGFVILIQNPKGGGLTGSLGGMTNQMMGVKQSNDLMEKATWIFAGLIGLMCILSTYLLTGTSSSSQKGMIDRVNTSPVQQPAAPGANTVPFNAPAQQQQAPAQQTAPAPAPAQEAAPAN